jgi:hypothetical protein
MSVKTICHRRGLSWWFDSTSRHATSVCLSVSRLVDIQGSYCFLFKSSFVTIVVIVIVVGYYRPCVSFHCVYIYIYIWLRDVFRLSLYRLLFRYKYITDNNILNIKLVSLSVSCVTLLLQLVDETEYTQKKKQRANMDYNLPTVGSISDVPAETFFFFLVK